MARISRFPGPASYEVQAECCLDLRRWLGLTGCGYYKGDVLERGRIYLGDKGDEGIKRDKRDGFISLLVLQIFAVFRPAARLFR